VEAPRPGLRSGGLDEVRRKQEEALQRLGVVPVEDQDFLWGHHAHVGLGNEPPRPLQALGVGGGVFKAAKEAKLRED
jgi:hypothetical protein